MAWLQRRVGPLGRSTAVERFVRRENIRRYRKLLREAKDDAERRLIHKLLVEEEQKDVAARKPFAAMPKFESHRR